MSAATHRLSADVTDRHVESIAKAYQIAITGEEDDWEELFLTRENLNIYHNSINGFDELLIEYESKQEFNDINGHRAVFYTGARNQKGQKRFDWVIIDCGHFRLAYTI